MSEEPSVNSGVGSQEFQPVVIGSVTIVTESQNSTSFTPFEGVPVTIVERNIEGPSIQLNTQTINLNAMNVVLANPIVLDENQQSAPAGQKENQNLGELPNGTIIPEGNPVPEVVDPITTQPVVEQ